MTGPISDETEEFVTTEQQLNEITVAAAVRAHVEREAYLERLRVAGEMMAAELTEQLGMDVTFELKPTRMFGEP